MEVATTQMKTVFMKEIEELENRLQDVIDENEALRKGMHEILDSVRRHDGKSVNFVDYFHVHNGQDVFVVPNFVDDGEGLIS